MYSYRECQCIPWDMVRPDVIHERFKLCDSYGNQCFYTKMGNASYMDEHCTCYPRCNTTYYSYNIDSQLPIRIQKECLNDISNPGWYYIYRKMAPITSSPVAFYDELTKMTKTGVFKADKMGDLRWYILEKCRESFQNDVAIVEIKIERNSHVIMKKSLKYTITDKIGTIGGSLGLFTGFSFMALIEIVYWILVTTMKIITLPLRNTIIM